MCGIAGILTTRLKTVDLAPAALRMARTLSHRGPDDEGVWVDERNGVAIGFRRLSTMDL